MRIIWINEYSQLIGGCEKYLENTVGLLTAKGVSSTLLYNPQYPSDAQFLNNFDSAFPIVDLKKQLSEIPHRCYLPSSVARQ